MALKIHKYSDLSGPLLHYNGTMVLRFGSPSGVRGVIKKYFGVPDGS